MAFSLYLHFPFCTNACSYCDFYKILSDPQRERAYNDAVLEETRIVARTIGDSDSEISTIFIGGGTPTLAADTFLSEWLNLLGESFVFSPDLEFSIENNPEALTVDKLASFKHLGINRPTFGIQSFRTDLLSLLGRQHDPDHSRRAVYWTNALGYKNFGVDMIFALPGQTSALLSKDLDEMLDLQPPHVSFYQLTIEEGTPLENEIAAGRIKPLDENVSLAMYRGGCELLADAGYERYEVSSFAKPGFECRHNLAYWEGADYIGLGPAAHSFVGGRRYANVADVDEYIRALGDGVRPSVEDCSEEHDRMVEAVMLGLRTAKGIDRERFLDRFGQPLETIIDQPQYDLFVKSGHLEPDQAQVRLTDDGFFVADEIIRRLIR